MHYDSKNSEPKDSKDGAILEKARDATDIVDGSPTTTDKNQSSFLDKSDSVSLQDKSLSNKENNNKRKIDYVVLARKYRPQNFSELIGQHSLVRTFTNAINLDRVAHAFILTGVRGVGKTTTARIIAKCLNATNGPTISPAIDDEQCLAIAQDRHPDVIEIDAASRTGVDDIREILDSIPYRPVFGRYKVYIIDEVHMLSRNAFNALLKTLEEPPDHVKFIFATTEIRKVPVTVLSRCQRFDLRRVSAEELLNHFSNIASQESAGIEKGALRIIARAADGSVRDGLSLLDQAIAAYGSGGSSATELDVSQMLGLADVNSVYDLFESVMAGSTDDTLSRLGKLYESGADPITILEDLLRLSHWLTRIKLVPQTAEGKTVSEVERVRGKKLSDQLSVSVLSRAWQILLKGLDEAKRAPIAFQAAEMILIRLCYASNLPTPADIIARLEKEDKNIISSNTQSTPLGIDSGGIKHQFTNSVIEETSNLPKDNVVGPPDSNPIVESGGGSTELKTLQQEIKKIDQDPISFRDLIALFVKKREIQISNHLYMNVYLVAYEPGRLEFRPNDLAPGNLAGEILNYLRSWQGSYWTVSVSGDLGDPTLSEQDSMKENLGKQVAARDPVVNAALEIFSGSRIERVISRETLDTTLTVDEDDNLDLSDSNYSDEDNDL
jgi:DNA polymerase-3 subunit gamma/tau